MPARSFSTGSLLVAEVCAQWPSGLRGYKVAKRRVVGVQVRTCDAGIAILGHTRLAILMDAVCRISGFSAARPQLQLVVICDPQLCNPPVKRSGGVFMLAREAWARSLRC